MAAMSWTFWRSTAKTSNLDLSVRRPSVRTPRQAPRRHYEAWLDYVYYSSEGLRLVGYQESLSEEQAQLIYRDGDALEMVARMPGVCISAMNYQGKFGHRVSTHELSDVHDPAGPGSGTATRPLAG